MKFYINFEVVRCSRHCACVCVCWLHAVWYFQIVMNVQSITKQEVQNCKQLNHNEWDHVRWLWADVVLFGFTDAAFSVKACWLALFLFGPLGVSGYEILCCWSVTVESNITPLASHLLSLYLYSSEVQWLVFWCMADGAEERAAGILPEEQIVAVWLWDVSPVGLVLQNWLASWFPPPPLCQS
jgi:hypothetical protein